MTNHGKSCLSSTGCVEAVVGFISLDSVKASRAIDGLGVWRDICKS